MATTSGFAGEDAAQTLQAIASEASTISPPTGNAMPIDGHHSASTIAGDKSYIPHLTIQIEIETSIVRLSNKMNRGVLVTRFRPRRLIQANERILGKIATPPMKLIKT